MRKYYNEIPQGENTSYGPDGEFNSTTHYISNSTVEVGRSPNGTNYVHLADSDDCAYLCLDREDVLGFIQWCVDHRFITPTDLLNLAHYADKQNFKLALVELKQQLEQLKCNQNQTK